MILKNSKDIKLYKEIVTGKENSQKIFIYPRPEYF